MNNRGTELFIEGMSLLEGDYCILGFSLPGTGVYVNLQDRWSLNAVDSQGLLQLLIFSLI